MNPFLLILLQAGINIAKGHGAPGTDTAGFILDAARAIDSLYEEETGQPLDWSKIREHEHLPPAGEPPAPAPPAPAPETPETPEAEVVPTEPPGDET